MCSLIKSKLPETKNDLTPLSEDVVVRRGGFSPKRYHKMVDHKFYVDNGLMCPYCEDGSEPLEKDMILKKLYPDGTVELKEDGND